MANGISYQQCKCILYEYAKYDPTVSKQDVYDMISDSTALALNKIEPGDRRIIKRNANRVIDKFKNMGEQSALELLAAVGNWLNDRGDNA